MQGTGPSAAPDLETTLLGPLSVPDGAGRAAEMEALAPGRGLRHPRPGDGTRRAYRAAWRSLPGLVRRPRPRAARRRSRHHRHVRWCAAPTRALPSARSACPSRRDQDRAPARRPLARPAPPRRSPWWSRASPAPKGVRPRRQAAPAVPGVLRLLLAARPPPTRRSARATAPCCCWASAPRCAAPSWSPSPSATSRPCPGRGCAHHRPLQDRPAGKGGSCGHCGQSSRRGLLPGRCPAGLVAARISGTGCGGQRVSAAERRARPLSAV